MARSPKLFYALAALALLIGLTGCELQREGGQNSDVAPLGELAPPTLAPLGADSSEVGAEAVAPPTALAVEATASPSPLGEGAAAPAPGEPAEATSQPAVDLEASGATENSAVEPGYEAAATEPESFTPPAEQEAAAQPATEQQQMAAEQAAMAQPETSQPTITEPVIVDASPQDLPSGGPIAANPPASDTMGDYGAISADGTHTVQAGDTLFSIGMRYGLDVQELMLLNGLTSETIYEGQTLSVSGAAGDYSSFSGGFSPPAFAPAAPSGLPSSGNTHIVAPGETLFSIATRYGTTVDGLASVNGLQPPFIIQPGQYLNIPSSGGNPYFAPNGNPYAAAPNEAPYYPDGNFPYPQNDPNAYYPQTGNAYPYQGGGVTHTVAPGETLYSISVRYGVSPQALVAANGLANPNQIFVGQVLVLP